MLTIAMDRTSEEGKHGGDPSAGAEVVVAQRQAGTCYLTSALGGSVTGASAEADDGDVGEARRGEAPTSRFATRSGR